MMKKWRRYLNPEMNQVHLSFKHEVICLEIINQHVRKLFGSAVRRDKDGKEANFYLIREMKRFLSN
jgi:hypothetical protein